MAGDERGRPAEESSDSAAIEIIVDDDGTVIFTDLPPELQQIVDELNPDAPRSTVCLLPEGPEDPADDEAQDAQRAGSGGPENSTDPNR